MSHDENGTAWVSRTIAAKHLGCSPHAVARLAQDGHITVRSLPGCDPRYLLSDVERLAQRSTRSAIPDARDCAKGVQYSRPDQGDAAEALAQNRHAIDARLDRQGGGQ